MTANQTIFVSSYTLTMAYDVKTESMQCNIIDASTVVKHLQQKLSVIG